MPGIFPDPATAGGVVAPSNLVANAFIPAAPFNTTSPITYLPSNCDARILPAQINAITSELLSLATCLNPAGTWNSSTVTNLCAALNGFLADGTAIANSIAFKNCAGDAILKGSTLATCLDLQTAINNIPADKFITSMSYVAATNQLITTLTGGGTVVADLTNLIADVVATFPVATDTIQGKVSLAVAANYPQTGNDTDAVTPKYLNEALKIVDEVRESPVVPLDASPLNPVIWRNNGGNLGCIAAGSIVFSNSFENVLLYSPPEFATNVSPTASFPIVPNVLDPLKTEFNFDSILGISINKTTGISNPITCPGLYTITLYAAGRIETNAPAPYNFGAFIRTNGAVSAAQNDLGYRPLAGANSTNVNVSVDLFLAVGDVIDFTVFASSTPTSTFVSGTLLAGARIGIRKVN